MVTDGNQTYHGDHFEILYRNIKSLCCVPGTNAMLQVNHTSKKETNSQKKRSNLWLPEVGGERGKGELDEGGQKVQTYGYRITKYQECNVQHDKYN